MADDFMRWSETGEGKAGKWAEYLRTHRLTKAQKRAWAIQRGIEDRARAIRDARLKTMYRAAYPPVDI